MFLTNECKLPQLANKLPFSTQILNNHMVFQSFSLKRITRNRKKLGDNLVSKPDLHCLRAKMLCCTISRGTKAMTKGTEAIAHMHKHQPKNTAMHLWKPSTLYMYSVNRNHVTEMYPMR